MPPKPEVFCKGCVNLIDQPLTCLFEGNIEERTIVNWYERKVIRVFIESPVEKNQNNDCPDFEQRIG